MQTLSTCSSRQDDRQTSDRLLTGLFTRAIDQLGTPEVPNENQTVVESELSVQLGGIYVESIEDAIRACLSVVHDPISSTFRRTAQFGTSNTGKSATLLRRSPSQ